MLFLILLCVFLSGCTSVNIQNFFTRFNNLEATFTRIITAIAYLFGLALAFRGVYALKLYGEARTMMSNHASMKAPAIYMLVSAVFMYLPTALGTINQGVFGEGFPLRYISAEVNHSVAFYTGILAFVRIVGLISFVRGWMYLAALAQQGQHHSVGKALTHIVGGIMAYNIEATIDLIKSPF